MATQCGCLGGKDTDLQHLRITPETLNRIPKEKIPVVPA
jgi:hypothetical protein